MTDKIEALALAIARTCGGFTPDSAACRLNNPGLLASYSDRHDADGRLRKFPNWQAGFKALCFDLELKCGGKSRCKLAASDPLERLLAVFKIRDPRKTLNFIRRALADDRVVADTPLAWFVAGGGLE